MNTRTKKFIACYIFTIALLFVIKPVKAQLTFGVRGGVNLSNVAVDNGFNPLDSIGIGYHAGGIIHYALSDAFSIQPEVLFSTKGWSQVSTLRTYTTTTKTDIKVNYSFIEIPVNLKYSLPMGLNFYGGPYFGYLMMYNYYSTVSITRQNDKIKDISDTKGLSSLDYGINVGLGYQSEMGLGFNAGYGIGLADINDPSAAKKYSHAVIAVSVSYLMGGGSSE